MQIPRITKRSKRFLSESLGELANCSSASARTHASPVTNAAGGVLKGRVSKSHGLDGNQFVTTWQLAIHLCTFSKTSEVARVHIHSNGKDSTHNQLDWILLKVCSGLVK